MAEMDYNEVAAAVEGLRELGRAIVAGLKSDGFTDREAHRIAAKIMSSETAEDEVDTPDQDFHQYKLMCLDCKQGPFNLGEAATHEAEDPESSHEYRLTQGR